MLIEQDFSTRAPCPPLPAAHQVSWQRGEIAIFVHFTVNTYTGREWGDGTESPAIVNPTKLEARQWAAAAKAAGARHMVLTAKHHDGFCLWPSAYTNHTIAASPFKRDIVREFVDACREHGLGAGLYLSPWDRHEKTYGDSPAYNRFYLNQLTELLTNYGELAEIWFDGACGEGPSGKRQQYDWPAYFALCAKLQPNAVTFGDGGTGARWIGNERGIAGDPNWAMVDPSIIQYPGDSGIDTATDARAKGALKMSQLQNGNEDGTIWRPGESDVSIRPGWFYHVEEDQAVRSVSNLVDLYFKSVGRNSFLLLNVPPTPEGLFHETDVNRLRGFGGEIRRLFSRDLAAGSTVTTTDKTIELRLPKPATFDILSLEEQIELGQRVQSYRVMYQDPVGVWQWLIEGHTIGYKKLERFDPVTATAFRLEIQCSRATPVIRAIGLYNSKG
jgi:alpha-L-fucosidase